MARHVTKADYDFGRAAEYRKVKLLDAKHVRIAEHDEIVASYNSSGFETRNLAQPGDYIIKTKGDGDGYVMQAHRFPEVYEADAANPGFYRNKLTRKCLLTTEDVVFTSPWGEEMNIAAGGVIVEAGPYIYGIDKFSFIANYGRVADDFGKETFALLSEPLEVQFEKARKSGFADHMTDITLRLQHASLFAHETKPMPPAQTLRNPRI